MQACTNGSPREYIGCTQVRHPENPKLLGRRNWCEITEYTATAEDPRLVGALNFSLRAENPKDQAGPKEVYNIPVPPYVHNPAGKEDSAVCGYPQMADMLLLAPYFGKFVASSPGR